MGDKVKEFRDKNPLLDFFAGFIPGVGEALDAHDFVHAAKDKDYWGMGLAAAGLIIPGFTGGLIKKGIKAAKGLVDKPNLSQALIEKGWKEIDGKIFSPSGEEFVRHSDGRLLSKKSADQARIADKNKADKERKLKLQQLKEKAFDLKAEEFRKRSRLDFSLRNWRSLARNHHQTAKETERYMEEAYPNFVKTYDELINSGKLRLNPTTKRYEAYFDTLLFNDRRLPKLIDKYKKGYRELNDMEAMLYVIYNSPQAKDKFAWFGISMRQGINPVKSLNFEAGRNKQKYPKWFDSDPAGALAYSGNRGIQLYGFPIRPSLINPRFDDKPRIIKRQTPNPSSNNWNGAGNSPIADFLSADRTTSINISEGPLKDDHATKVLNREINGIFSVVGEDIPVKSVFGGSGMYDIKGENLYKPFVSYAIPIGLGSIIGFKALNNERRD